MPENESIWETLGHFYTEVVLFNIQNVGVTLSHLVVGLFSVIVAMILSAVVRSILRKRVFKRLKLDKGMEYALLKFTHYVILIIGIYIGLQSINIPLGALVGLFAVIGVGIGFGLQNLAANFTSGVILLIERPVKLGDRVELDGVWGDVVRINLRTTVINTPDDVSIIVPNSKLLDEYVTNFSYGNPRIRIRVPVGVAYGSDVERVTRLLIEAGEKNSKVMAAPKPSVLFREFGDSSLNFELLCWIPRADMKFLVISELNYAIDKAFRENGVEIPFPQRDLHLRSSNVKLSGG
ncbi:MAG: mechanosensitive ion channel [Verrucomicrobia bacterium]|nr:mechanosensitive ion channel [Verrucomicrobiota bacterium]MCH8526462.1 mechanosensitive ion channel [Kiritimatiellia bacterium]